jgi:hypothetical protein
MDHIENTFSIVVFQQYLDHCMRILRRGNRFTEKLPSNSLGIVGVFIGRYQTTHILSRDHCVARAMHGTVCNIVSTVPNLRRLVASLPPRRSGPIPVQVMYDLW